MANVATVNILRPVRKSGIKRSRSVDPGPDRGEQHGRRREGLSRSTTTNPAYRGAAFVANMRVNADADRYDTFNNFEVMLTKRKANRWFANASFLASKYHAWLNPVFQTPNDEFFALNEIWK